MHCENAPKNLSKNIRQPFKHESKAQIKYQPNIENDVCNNSLNFKEISRKI